MCVNFFLISLMYVADFMLRSRLCVCESIHFFALFFVNRLFFSKFCTVYTEQSHRTMYEYRLARDVIRIAFMCIKISKLLMLAGFRRLAAKRLTVHNRDWVGLCTNVCYGKIQLSKTSCAGGTCK